MAARYYQAPDVEAIGRELIREHHPHLMKARVEFLFVNKAPKGGGKVVWGTARLVSGVNAFLAGQDIEEGDATAFFAIVISAPVWEGLAEEKRKALVDHELAHCWVEETDEGETRLRLLKHDLEEFGAIVLRHGLWRQDVEQFVHMAEEGQHQRSLLDLDEPETSGDRAAKRADQILASVGISFAADPS